MKKIEYKIRPQLEPYINSILVQEEASEALHTNIPLYADGYPGIMFQQSQNGFYLLPRNKKLSELFLYGQTLNPVSLDTQGSFRFAVIQLYPFASKYLLGIDPKVLNDDCFDLLSLEKPNCNEYLQNLSNTDNLADLIEHMFDLTVALLNHHQITENDYIQLAIHRILSAKGQVLIKDLISELHLTERTFERQFVSQVGLTAKQFSKIIQFQYSLSRLEPENYTKLTEVGLESGFSDQAHFIREFKRYTGKTPSYYLSQYSN